MAYLAGKVSIKMWQSEEGGMGGLIIMLLRRGLHFLVVQADEEADTSAGLWLLQARELPKI